MDIYCLRCRSKTPTSDGHQITTAKGRHAYAGTCDVCGCRKQCFTAKQTGGAVPDPEATLRLWKEREANPNWQAEERARLMELAPAPQKYDPKEYEARMRAQYPDWDSYTEATKRAIVNAPFAKKQGELSNSAFAKAIIQGVNDPILAEGINVAAQFLIDGGVAAAKALLKNPTDLNGAVSEIIKQAAPGIAYAFTASHKNLSPAAKAVREIAAHIAGKDTEGKGIVADVYQKLTGKYPGAKEFEKVISEHGDKTILTMSAMRTPVNSVYQSLIRAVREDIGRVYAPKMDQTLGLTDHT